MKPEFSIHRIAIMIENAIDGKISRLEALMNIEEALQPLLDVYYSVEQQLRHDNKVMVNKKDVLIDKLNDKDDQTIDQTIMVGALVKTNHEFSKYFRGKFLEGRVIDYDERSGVVTFMTEHGREMLHDHWLMVTGG